MESAYHQQWATPWDQQTSQVPLTLGPFDLQRKLPLTQLFHLPPLQGTIDVNVVICKLFAVNVILVPNLIPVPFSGWNLCFNSEGLEKLNGVSG